MIYKTDYHIHTLFSDGKAAPEEYISPARDKGLKEIGFSEHLNLLVDGQQWCMDPSMTKEYVDTIKALGRKENEIAVRVGLEVDYFPGKNSRIFSFLNSYDLDYIIGSVHYMGDTTVDHGPEFYEGKDIDRLWSDYFEILIEAVESGIFDILGHCDLVRIFGFRPARDPVRLYHKLAESMARHDVALEINTNGRNRLLGDFYPDRKYLNLFSRMKVPVCVNSDAHFPSRVAQYFDEAYSLLRDAGYTEMTTFIKRDRYSIPFDI